MTSDNMEPGEGPEALRLDRYLWHIRVVKTRALGGILAEKGRVRVNGARVEKAHRLVRVGDVLTVAHGPGVLVVRIVALGTRRGPASEARTLYVPVGEPIGEDGGA